MVSKAFDIYGDDLDSCRLLIETGSDYIACCRLHREYRQLRGFELFNFDSEDFEDFEHLFSNVKLNSRLLPGNNDDVELIWANEKAICVPTIYFSESLVPSLFTIMHGITEQITYSVSGLDDMVIVGYIPTAAAKAYAGFFKVSSNHHKYYTLLNARKDDDKHSLYVVFTHSNFIYLVYKENKLQLIQMRLYKTGDDVLYHLLNALNMLGMPPANVMVTASGLIDESSGLYKTLHPYFGDFRFYESERTAFAADGFHEYPLHYFASYCQYIQ